jgi:hypothetical protein
VSRFSNGKSTKQQIIDYWKEKGYLLQAELQTDRPRAFRRPTKLVVEPIRDIKRDDFILLDEPISHRDKAKSLVMAGMTVLAVLHDPNMAFRYGQVKVTEVGGKRFGTAAAEEEDGKAGIF